MNLNERKKYASYVCNTRKVLEDFDKIYPFTTENLSGYFKLRDIKDKSILTVGSSGDQALNAFLMGAKDVTIFDVNPFTKYYFDLKKSAILNLSLDEFLNFFCYCNYPSLFRFNSKAFDLEVFNKLVKDLNGESLEFWTYLFQIFKYKNIRKRLFTDDEYSFKVVSKVNNYLSQENYSRLKENIKGYNPNFIESDLLSLPEKLNKSFDTIYLSNISFYLRDYSNSIHLFLNNVLKLKDFMNKDASMYFAYLYDMNMNTVPFYYWDQIYRINLIKKILCKENIVSEQFKGVTGIYLNKEKYKDSVLYLKK